VDPPTDTAAIVDPHFHAAKIHWQEPVFDPAHPESFPSWLANHRMWMLRLFARRFGEPLHLGTPQALNAEDTTARR
jgi:hypothetical protein